MRAAALFALAAALIVALVVVTACDPPVEATGCDPACKAAAPACDDGCPAVASEVCVDSACVAVADGEFDVAITVALGRDIDQDVVAAAIGIVDDGDCATVGPVKDAANVVAGNRIELSGGSFHPDLHVGLVAAGDYVVVVDALDASAAILASNCVAVSVDGDEAVTLDVPAL